VKVFRFVSLAEGVSWLLLAFIAMPLKYGAGWPLGVQLMGRVHGALFVLFIFTLARAAIEAEWGFAKVMRAFIASLVPFGAFWLEKQLREEERAARVVLNPGA
jgi:integral membrane protein